MRLRGAPPLDAHVDAGHRGTALEHTPVRRLEVEPEGGQHLVHRAAEVLLDGQVVERRQGLVEADVAKVLVDEADAHRRGLERGREQHLGLHPALLGAQLVGDVERRAGVPEHRAVGGEHGRGGVDDGAVLAVGGEHPVLLRVRLAAPLVGAHVALHAHAVVGVDAVDPPVAELLVERAPGEVEPALVQEDDVAVRVGHPDEERGRVRQRLEALVARVERRVGSRGACLDDVGVRPPAAQLAHRAVPADGVVVLDEDAQCQRGRSVQSCSR